MRRLSENARERERGSGNSRGRYRLYDSVVRMEPQLRPLVPLWQKTALTSITKRELQCREVGRGDKREDLSRIYSSGNNVERRKQQQWYNEGYQCTPKEEFTEGRWKVSTRRSREARGRCLESTVARRAQSC